VGTARNAAQKVWHTLPDGVRGRALQQRKWWRRHRPGASVRWGNLPKAAPLSTQSALDRGLPIDRYYIGEFLRERAADVRGDVMEMSRSSYTRTYGGDRVVTSTVVDIDPTNEQATLRCDLCEPRSLPREQFDCIVFTQTLHLLVDLDAALDNLWGALRPGGVLLLTVPALSCCTPIEADYWRFTPLGLEALLTRTLPAEAHIATNGRGNSFAAAAQIVAASVEDVGVRDLQDRDPAYPVVVEARVVKPSSPTDGA
jgi:SAM-dependent methyltransferase